MNLKEIGLGTATVEIETSKELHSNQQGTVHGGLISELADAAIGTLTPPVLLKVSRSPALNLKSIFIDPFLMLC